VANNRATPDQDFLFVMSFNKYKFHSSNLVIYILYIPNTYINFELQSLTIL